MIATNVRRLGLYLMLSFGVVSASIAWWQIVEAQNLAVRPDNPEVIAARRSLPRGSIWDEGPGPGAFRLEVNSVYPKDQPLGTVPPNILKALPPLPEDLEYRFIYRHLAIRDQQANLIVDFMPAAIPGK